MDMTMKTRFIELWNRYFNGAELPISFYYTNAEDAAERVPARFIVFKRFDMLEQSDDPCAVIFFATPDVLSGLFTLANYDEAEPNGVFCTFSAGCGSIVQYHYLEKDSTHPKAVIGMFDVSAPPYVPKETLTFAVPMNKFIRLVHNMEESFLITRSSEKVKKRMG